MIGFGVDENAAAAGELYGKADGHFGDVEAERLGVKFLCFCEISH